MTVEFWGCNFPRDLGLINTRYIVIDGNEDQNVSITGNEDCAQ